MPRFMVLPVLLLCLLLPQAHAYNNCVTLSNKYGIRLYWDVAGNVINVGMEGAVTGNGWLAMGLYPRGGPTPHANVQADVWMLGRDNNCGVNCQGGYCLVDTYLPDTEVFPDTIQSFAGISTSVVGNLLIGNFSRNLDTGSTQDTAIVPGAPIDVIWACHPSQPLKDTCGVDRHLMDITPAGQPRTGCMGQRTVDFGQAGQSCVPPEAEGGSFSSPADDFHLQFEVLDDELKFTMDAKTTGWVGFGFSEEGGGAHIDTDMLVGWIEDGKVVLLDQWSKRTATPSEDDQQDFAIIETESGEEDGVTTIAFTRKFDTGDSDDLVLEDKTYTLQWSYGVSDGSGTTYSKHVVAGLAEINFFTGAESSPIKITAGVVLCLVIAVLMLLWIAIHYAYKLHKKRVRKAVEADLEASGTMHAHGFEENAGNPRYTMTPSKSTDPMFALGNAGNSHFGASVSAAPAFAANNRQSYYFKGSEAVPYEDTDYADAADDYDYGLSENVVELQVDDNDDDDDDDGHVAPKLSGHEAKGMSGKWATRLHRLRNYRIPRTHIKIEDVLIMVAFIALNAVCLLAVPPKSSKNGWDSTAWNEGLGSLVGGNSLLVVVVVARNNILAWLLGIPFDRLVMFHRWLGRWVFLLCLGHIVAALVTWGDEESGTTIFEELVVVTDTETGVLGRLSGLFGFVFLFSMMITSYEWFRRNKFDLFYWSHFVFLLFYLCAAFHVEEMLPFVLAAAFWYAVDRILRMLKGVFPKRGVIVAKENDVIRIRFPRHFFARYRVGQYVFLNFPTLSFLEWHPFTLSSSPLEPFCEVHIKRLGDHTAKLQELAHQVGVPTQPHPTLGEGADLWVRADGPYGQFSLNFKRFPIICLLGGGIGVTPLIALLKAIYRYNISEKKKRKQKQTNVVQAVYFIWCFPNEDVFSWFSDVIKDIDRRAGQKGRPILNLFMHATRSETVGSDPMIQYGRPDIDAVWNQMAGDPSGERVAVYACGPSPLVTAGWDACVKYSTRSAQGFGAAAAGGPKRFDFHHEIFEF